MIPKLLVENRFSILLVSLLLFVLFVPAVVEATESMTVVPWALSVIVLAIVLSTWTPADKGRFNHKVIAGGALAALLVAWTYYFVGEGAVIEKVEAVIFALLLFNSCGLTLRQLSHRKRVDREALAAALSAFLLFGLAMSRVYLLLYLFDPDSFRIQSEIPEYSVQPLFLYFSFVVLSTVGFGDIIPVSALSRSLSVVETIFGLFYLAVVISRLVSLYGREENQE